MFEWHCVETSPQGIWAWAFDACFFFPLGPRRSFRVLEWQACLVHAEQLERVWRKEGRKNGRRGREKYYFELRRTEDSCCKGDNGEEDNDVVKNDSSLFRWRFSYNLERGFRQGWGMAEMPALKRNSAVAAVLQTDLPVCLHLWTHTATRVCWLELRDLMGRNPRVPFLELSHIVMWAC